MGLGRVGRDSDRGGVGMTGVVLSLNPQPPAPPHTHTHIHRLTHSARL